MENRYTKLIKNTFIFTIGSFGSRILTFLIVPFYTFVLTTAEYGKIDLFTTTISLMLPFTTLLMQEALIRFVSVDEIDKKIALSNSFVVFLVGVLITILMIPIYLYGFEFGENTSLYIIIMIFNSYNAIFSQYLKAIGKNISYTFYGIINTIVLLGSNLLLLLYFKWGLQGYLISILISQIASALYVTKEGEILKDISFTKIDLSVLRVMLKYTIPLVPNSLMWWIMNAGDKYIINYYLGDSANGIYSIAMKVPTLISMIYNIFMQAWQLSAIEEKDSKEYNNFFNNVFVLLSSVIVLLSSVIIISVQPIFSLCLAEAYQSSWKYVPFLCIAMIISCFSTFFAVIYVVSKDSKKAFTTTVYGAIINVAFNFILIKYMGLYGVAIGTILGYIVVAILRIKHTQKYLKSSEKYSRVICSLFFLIIESIIILIFNNFLGYCLAFAIVIFELFIYRNEIKKIFLLTFIKIK